MKRAIPLIILALVVGSSGGNGDDEDDTTTTAAFEETTSSSGTIAPEPSTTTTIVATTTTTQPEPTVVEPTPLNVLLQPYNGGEVLFPPGTVEAHWYIWDGYWVVLYRGFDASSGDPICAGNSLFVGTGWIFNTSSPHVGAVDEICVDAQKIAEPPHGVYSCGTLLYYWTEIPITESGDLWGSLEMGTGTWMGYTSDIPADAAAAPTFEPGLPGYRLPDTGVSAKTDVFCP